MSTLASDNFNRANGGLGSSWTTVTGNGAPQINTSQVNTVAVGNDSYAYYNGVSWPADQWSQCALKTVTGASGKAAGPIVRAVPGANTFYLFHAEGVIGSSTVLEIRKCIAGAYTTIATTGATSTVATGDVLYLEVQGTTLVARKNGTFVLSVTDSSIGTGNAGIGVFSDTGAVTDAALDDWSGGDFASPATIDQIYAGVRRVFVTDDIFQS